MPILQHVTDQITGPVQIQGREIDCFLTERRQSHMAQRYWDSRGLPNNLPQAEMDLLLHEVIQSQEILPANPSSIPRGPLVLWVQK